MFKILTETILAAIAPQSTACIRRHELLGDSHLLSDERVSTSSEGKVHGQTQFVAILVHSRRNQLQQNNKSNVNEMKINDPYPHTTRTGRIYFVCFPDRTSIEGRVTKLYLDAFLVLKQATNIWGLFIDRVIYYYVNLRVNYEIYQEADVFTYQQKHL